METIDDLVKLDGLTQRLRNVNANVRWDNGINTLSGAIFTSDKKKRDALENSLEGNIAAFATMPEQIRVSPEIAVLLAESHRDHSSKEAALSKEARSKGLYHVLVLSASSISAALTLTPHGFGQAAKSWADYVEAGNEISEKYKKLWAERDKTSAFILGSYQLSETSPGEYVLNRGSWSIVEKSEYNGRYMAKHDELELAPVGIDPKLDLSKLPKPEVGHSGIA